MGGAGRVSGEDCLWKAVPLIGKAGTVGVRTDRKWIQVSIRRSLGARGTVSLEGRAGRIRETQAMDVFSVSQETVSAFCSSGKEPFRERLVVN